MSDVLKVSGPIRVGKLAADPANPENGFIYYNTTTNKFRKYINGAFEDEVDQSVITNLVATDIAYERADGSKKNIQAGSDELESATSDLDDAIGALASSPTNYTPTDAGIVADHLSAIDSALGSVSSDASGVTYTPGQLSDWDSSTDPGNVDGGLDQLASRVKTNEGDIALKANDADVIKKDGSVAFTANQSMNGNKLTSLADPTDAGDAASKSYVDFVMQAGPKKTPVRVASPASTNIDLSVAGDGTLDGVTLADGDRVLLHAQSTGSENGIYDAVTASDRTTWVRSSDANDNDKVFPNISMWVEEGSTYADSAFTLITDAPIVLDTTSLSFIKTSGAGQINAGSALSKTGNTLDVNVDDTTIEVNTDQLRVKDAGISDAKIATGIDASKLADGSVSNTELQYINSLTSNAQDQINAKLSNVVEDTTPQLGGNLDLNGNDLEDTSNEVVIAGQNSVRRAKQASKTSFVEEEYIHSIALLASQTNTVISDLTFAHATTEGMEITFKVKEASTGDIKIGTIRIVTNGTNVVLNEVSTETADTGITFSAVVNGANINVRYSSGANGATMRADVKKFLA